jgi:hypothetical protein
VNERDWQSRVVGYARLRGWLVNHARPATTAGGWRTPVQGDPGFPDLALARGQPATRDEGAVVTITGGRTED